MTDNILMSKRVGDVAVLRLSRGVTNPLNLDLVSQLGDALQRASADPAVRAVVLCSASDKFFSIGLDLPAMINLPRDGFRVFMERFEQLCSDLFACPKPTVAALTGHATAGGCILATCCDYRFIAEGRKFIGMNEIKLGVPVPFLTHCILGQMVGWRHTRDIADSGEFYGPEAALRMGLVDQILPLVDILPKTLEWAAKLGTHPGTGFSEIKRFRTRAVLEQVAAHGAEARERFLDAWYSDDARARLREAAAKF
jgi:enoyl-CoA hydratase/carnithine racemase